MSLKHMIPNRRASKINVKVSVAALHTHQTIPAAGGEIQNHSRDDKELAANTLEKDPFKYPRKKKYRAMKS